MTSTKRKLGMGTHLMTAQAHTTRRHQQAQTLARFGHWESDVATGVSVWSDETCRIYGLDVSDNKHTMQEWLSFVHPEDLPSVLEAVATSHLPTDDPSFRHRIVWRDGTIRHIEAITQREFDENGKLVTIYGVVQDRSKSIAAEQAMEELNQRLKDRAEELAMSNAELEQFAFVASHDLQEPLRMITSLMSQLQNKYSGLLDTSALEYINRAVDGAERMRTIISDLLEYSHVSRGMNHFEHVDVANILDEVVMLSNVSITESNATITCSAMPRVVAIKTQLQQVFQNLIGNAIKYRRDGVAPVIHINASETPTHWQFDVIDNGIGIEPRYFEKIFVAFQRLHSNDTYSGSGIGLAICHQIAAKHRGKIWVESTADSGSTFHITINKAYASSALANF